MSRRDATLYAESANTYNLFLIQSLYKVRQLNQFLAHFCDDQRHRQTDRQRRLSLPVIDR